MEKNMEEEYGISLAVQRLRLCCQCRRCGFDPLVVELGSLWCGQKIKKKKSKIQISHSTVTQSN